MNADLNGRTSPTARPRQTLPPRPNQWQRLAIFSRPCCSKPLFAEQERSMRQNVVFPAVCPVICPVPRDGSQNLGRGRSPKHVQPTTKPELSQQSCSDDENRAGSAVPIPKPRDPHDPGARARTEGWVLQTRTNRAATSGGLTHGPAPYHEVPAVAHSAVTGPRISLWTPGWYTTAMLDASASRTTSFVTAIAAILLVAPLQPAHEHRIHRAELVLHRAVRHAKRTPHAEKCAPSANARTTSRSPTKTFLDT